MQVIMGPAWLAGWHPLPYLWSLSPSLYFPPCFWLPNIKPWFDWIAYKKVFFSSVVQYFNQKMLKTRTRSKLLIESPLPQNIYTICQPYQDGGNTCQNHRHNTLLSQLLWKSCSGVLEEMSTPLEQMLTLKQELTLKQVLRCENMNSTYNAVQHMYLGPRYVASIRIILAIKVAWHPLFSLCFANLLQSNDDWEWKERRREWEEYERKHISPSSSPKKPEAQFALN